MTPAGNRCRNASARRAAGGPLLAAALWLLAVAAFPALLLAQDTLPISDIASLDLEELATIRVTSAAGRPEAIARTAAAISVITREDIRRSGVTSLHEALRLVPGLEVARVGTRDWAISARGFNQQSSNKLLLLIDGRMDYSPIFAGVFWDAIAMAFDEVDRIEVIRGPGATLWGANAMNGVINIVTRPARESRGGRLAAAVGLRDRRAAGLRYGLSLGEWVAGRFYLSGTRRDLATLADGTKASDDWQLGNTGFRIDGAPTGSDTWTIQGNAYAGHGGNRLVVPMATEPYAEFRDDELKAAGGNLMARWVRQLGPASELSVQADYDYTRRRQFLLYGTMIAHVAQLDVRHRWKFAPRHDVVWGAGYHFVTDDLNGAAMISFAPERRTTHRVSAFAQDDITLSDDRLILTLGSKFSHSRYSGVEVQPNARLLWTPRPTQTVWAAVSRAVRIPSRIDEDVRVVSSGFNTPFEARLAGSDAFDAEGMIAYEVGSRIQPGRHLALDLAFFYNDYNDIRTLSLDSIVTADPRPIAHLVVANDARARTYGAEASATVRAASWWRWRGTYSYLQMRVAPEDDAPATTLIEAVPGDNPVHQASLWSSVDISPAIELDVRGRYVDALRGRGIPSYIAADVRVGWRVTPQLDVALVGQDLLEERHAEFPTIAFIADTRQIARRALARMSWRF